MKEADIQKKVLEKLKRMPNLHVLRIVPGTRGNKGISDIICCYHGLFIAIELKSKNGKLTKKQKAFQEKVKMAGGLTFTCRSEHEVFQCLKSMPWLTRNSDGASYPSKETKNPL